MLHRTWRQNPWSIPLVLAGLVFTLTASAYAVMAVRQLDADHVSREAEPSPRLIELLDRYGARLMLAELAVLAALVAAAIGTDRWHSGEPQPPPDNPPGERGT